MSRTNKKSFQKTNKYKSNRFYGFNNFKLKPYGIQGWTYTYMRFRDKNGNKEEYLREDCISEINKTAYRMKLKNELKNIIEKECLE